ncbi:putative membrane or secreted protein [Rhodopirellula maiorica SM1]|uniref:Putative membrane or secreted protein n=1 Tax=Rhodopirellula maiorica SM1 TaxID=1265738 RepID=M5RI20_9BACT|nr:LPS assembly lipoprotein LptE [Rhodopirellula maiorica]EMI18940.1 putative membrane or secreted protein [Rhodopirellula maiorica SM1]
MNRIVIPIDATVRSILLLVVLLSLSIASGCSLYQYGPASLYRSDIRTVHVPIVRNETYRHDLGPRLSLAIVTEIESRTPFKVVSDPGADSTLLVVLTNENKNVLTETTSDDPRALDATLTARADWVSRRGEKLFQNTVAPQSGSAISFSQDSRFVPEAGQSIDTALQATIEKLAQRIVSQMELRW